MSVYFLTASALPSGGVGVGLVSGVGVISGVGVDVAVGVVVGEGLTSAGLGVGLPDLSD